MPAHHWMPFVAAMFIVGTANAQDTKLNLDIKPQPIRLALQTFGKQSGLQVLFRSEGVAVDDVISPQVSGELSPQQALDQLLANSGLRYEFINSHTVRISPAVEPPAKRTSDHLSSPGAADVVLTQYSKPAASSGSSDAQAVTGGTAPADASEPEPTKLQDVIVTGTLIRGIAPAGANVITMDPQAIAATGATSSNDLLNNIPQLGDFGNTNQQISAVNLQIQVYRPNIRNLPGLNTSGGSTTLVLMDGHRLVGEGIKETAPDANMIPPSLLERVEVLPDGGSSTYGADAIGGVINFVTKRHFDGVEVNARYGFADSFNDPYKTYDANATVGHDWGRASAYLSYSYTRNTALFGGERAYVKKFGPNGTLNPDLTCSPGNVIITSGLTQTTYGLPALLPNTSNPCDHGQDSTIFPEVERHSVFAGVSADFTDSLKLDLRSYYTTQLQTNNAGPFTSTSTINGTNPFYQRVSTNPAPQAPSAENVAFTWAPVSGNQAGYSNTRLSSWGVTPTFTYDFGGAYGWQIREMTNYGGSLSRVFNPALNPTLLAAAAAGTTAATALDPYNIAATNPAVLAGIENYELYGLSRQELIDERVVADGTLFALPGGEVRLASGGEFMHETYKAKLANFVIGNEGSTPFSEGLRNSYALFAETNIPIVGEANAAPGVKSLSLNASVRYDHYSDFGGTTNPKLALTFEPIDSIRIRGDWGTDFNAPSLADTHATDNRLLIVPAIVFANPLPGKFVPAQTLWPLIATQGGVPNISPQTAHTWEVGADITPSFVPELKLSTTYYHIKFFNTIGTPPVGNLFNFYSYFTQSFTMAPTPAQVTALASQVPGGLAQVAPLLVPGALPVYALVDDRRRNLGDSTVSGLDFSINYGHKTDFGSIDANFNGSYDLQSRSAALPGLPFFDNLAVNQSRFRFATTAGTTIGDFRAQATLNYLAGFNNTPSAANNNQSHIGSFSVVNLFFRYDFSHVDSRSTSLTSNLALTLTINNVLNRDPPLYQGTYNNLYNGYANGSTVGRLTQFGFAKKL